METTDMLGMMIAGAALLAVAAFELLPGLSGRKARLTNHDKRPFEGRFDGQRVRLKPGENVILPVEVANHLKRQADQRTTEEGPDGEDRKCKPLALQVEEVEAVYTVPAAAPQVFEDPETGLKAGSLAELLAKVREKLTAEKDDGTGKPEKPEKPAPTAKPSGS